MGMAASQARYIALSARKTNIEYEGQQINQSRLALANQSANLFNQMMGMDVPAPPSIRDYTTVQYSFSDGINTEVLSNFYQLGNVDSDYNYVVTTYHNEKVFTGFKKKANDPQIQATVENHYSYDPNNYDQNDEKIVTKAFSNEDGTYMIETSDSSTTVFRPVTEKETDEVRAINLGNGEVDPDKKEAVLSETRDASGLTWAACSETADKVALGALLGKDPDDVVAADAALYKKTTDGKFVLAANETETDTDIWEMKDVGKGPNIDATTGFAKDAAQTWYTDGKKFVKKEELDKAVEIYDEYVRTGYRQKNSITYRTPENNPEFSNYTAFGNCVLTELTAADLADEDIAATIAQILKDMQAVAGDTKASENLMACFDMDDKGELIYKGGLFTFKMGGQTYYTTRNDLDFSMGSSIIDNKIDVQQNKFAYYGANYQETKVEDTKKALLETDGSGRFKTMKLEDDSVVYTLNAEEVTDEASYNDAMNKYYYENAEYEKKLQDINARTKIIQAQDRTLELRLEQLGTEQSALQNEMEAVKKVVDKHVEQGFKTFGG